MSISELKEMDIPSLKYMCMMVWHKPNGPNSFGCPTYNMEPILVAKRGRPIPRYKGFQDDQSVGGAPV